MRTWQRRHDVRARIELAHPQPVEYVPVRTVSNCGNNVHVSVATLHVRGGVQATQSLADAVTASDVMDACMDALRGKAAKKPMPSALKKKGAAKAGGRKKARFEGADSDDGSADGGGAAAAADAPRPKAKVPATKANVNKLISGGGGWMKRRKAAEEEEEEGDADEIEDSDVRRSLLARMIACSATMDWQRVVSPCCCAVP